MSRPDPELYLTGLESDTGLGGAEASLLRLLSHISDQIQDADRRHESMLREMQNRIGSMGQDARTLRPKIPGAFVGAFDRIEDGLAQLALRLSEAGAAGGSAAPDAAPTAAPAEVVAEPPYGRDRTGFAPAPLRSATEAAGGEFIRPTAPSTAIDPFDVVDNSVPGNPADLWDPHAAEALTSFYETTLSMPSERAGPGGDPASAMLATAAGVPAPVAVADGSPERAWLEGRFADIARRIEQSLAEAHTEQGFMALGERIELLEQRMGTALEGLSTRSDLDNLRILEANINELALHLEQTQTQLTRLDGIESRLHEVMEQLSDLRLSGSPDHASAPAGSLDVDRIAEAVAARSAELQAAAATPEPIAGLEKLHALMESFIAERRQGEEQTSVMLDTMQQAMIRVLDRMDAIEASPPPAAAHPMHEDDDWSEDDADRRFHAPAASIATAAAPAEAPLAGSTLPADSRGYGPTASEPQRPTPHTPVPGLDEVELRSPVDRIRQDFIADAQRAKLRAAAEAALESQNRQEAGQKGASATARVAHLPKGEAPAAAGSILGIPTKRLLVSALALVVLINGALLLMPGKRPASDAAVIETPAASAPAEGRAEQGAPAEGKGAAGPRSEAPAGQTEATADLEPDGVELPFRLFLQQAAGKYWTKQGMAALEATPASLGAAAKRPLDTKSATAGMRHSSLDLPPATVGPLSLRMAAASGDPSAEFEVASRLAEGKGTNQNFTEALRWYRRSAEQGFAQAQYRLGTLYERGLGTDADIDQAHIWYQRAAEQGNVKAMHNLAVISAGRSSGSPDYDAAAQWFTRAAERGLADSQFNLAVLCENGLGVEKDLKQAYTWFSLASKGGDAHSIRRRDQAEAKLTPAEIAEAKAVIAAFAPQRTDPIVNDPRVAGQDWQRRQTSDGNS